MNPEAGERGQTRRRFPPRRRLRRRTDFRRVMRSGERVSDDVLQLCALPNGLPESRLGLIVGKRHGNAVRRNRIRRLLREAFRIQQDSLAPGLDLTCAPIPGARISLNAAMGSLVALSRRAQCRCARAR